jgi:hypothetical protein
MRSSAGPEEPVSVADLLDRHGRVLTDRGEPLPAPRRPLSGRMRRTLVAVGSVLAAGSVLGGAVAVSTAGHEAPLGRTPGGLVDRIDPGAAEYGGTAGGPASGAGPRAAGDGPTARIGSTAATGAIPAPRAATGPGAAPSAIGAPTVVVVPPVNGTAGDRAEDRSAPAPTGRATTPSAPATAPSGGTAGTGTTAPAESAGGDPVTGLVGGIGKAVGGLLGR